MRVACLIVLAVARSGPAAAAPPPLATPLLDGSRPDLVRAEWRQPHFDAAHDGFNPYESQLSTSNVAGLEVAWTGTASVWFQGSILVVGGTVYAAGYAENLPDASWLGAFDRTTGQPRWRARLTLGSGVTGLAYAEGRVFVSTIGDHRLRAYDAATGTRLWFLQANGAVGPPTVAKGVLYVQTANYMLYAVDPASGHIRWSVRYDGDGVAGPAVIGDRLFVTGTDVNVIESRDATTGALVWSTPTDNHPKGSATVADGLVFAGTLNGTLYALDALTGDIVWQAATGSRIESTPAVAGGVVYAGDNDGDLHAWDEFSGQELWSAHTDRAFVLSSPIVANGVVYAATLGAYAFDAFTGRQLWSSPTDIVNMAPSVVDGVLYVGDFAGKLRAYALP
jgi:outer membrane protein assembly factor BamB